jgi:hypothetical protein
VHGTRRLQIVIKTNALNLKVNNVSNLKPTNSTLQGHLIDFLHI